MPPTFAGSYIQEPSDLRIVCTEADLVASFDDPGGESAQDVVRWADLTDPQKAAIVAVANPLIVIVEGTIDGYAKRQGYAVPLAPVDPKVKEIAARLLWISMRQTAKRITAKEADEERETVRRGDLRDIEEGRFILTAAKTGVKPAEAQVYKITDAATRDTTGSVPRLSRTTLGGF